ncbi:hypothetical protein D3C75_1146430 [compost metagenome]
MELPLELFVVLITLKSFVQFIKRRLKLIRNVASAKLLLISFAKYTIRSYLNNTH